MPVTRLNEWPKSVRPDGSPAPKPAPVKTAPAKTPKQGK